MTQGKRKRQRNLEAAEHERGSEHQLSPSQEMEICRGWPRSTGFRWFGYHEGGRGTSTRCVLVSFSRFYDFLLGSDPVSSFTIAEKVGMASCYGNSINE